MLSRHLDAIAPGLEQPLNTCGSDRSARQANNFSGAIAMTPLAMIALTRNICSLGKAAGLLMLASEGGVFIAELLALPVPGPAIGLVLLFGYFILSGGPDAATIMVFERAIRWLPLLFVPAGAGIFGWLAFLAEAWIALLGAIVFGTIATLAVTAVVAERLFRVAGEPSPERKIA